MQSIPLYKNGQEFLAVQNINRMKWKWLDALEYDKCIYKQWKYYLGFLLNFTIVELFSAAAAALPGLSLDAKADTEETTALSLLSPLGFLKINKVNNVRNK